MEMKTSYDWKLTQNIFFDHILSIEFHLSGH